MSESILQKFWAYHEDHDGKMFVSLPADRTVQVGEQIVLRNDRDEEVTADVLSRTSWGCYVKW